MASTNDGTRRDPGSQKCLHHPKKSVKYVCLEKICRESAACGDCVVSIHQGHKMVKMRDLTVMQDDIQEYVSKAEKQYIPELVGYIQKAETNIVQNRKHFQELTNEIRQRGCEMREQIDVITDRLIGRCKKLEKMNANVYKAHRKQLEKMYENVCVRVNDCKQCNNNGNNTTVTELAEKIKDTEETPVVPSTPVVEMRISSCWKDQLEQVFGCISNDSFKNFSYPGDEDDKVTSPSASSKSDWSEFSEENQFGFDPNDSPVSEHQPSSFQHFNFSDPSGTLHPVPGSLDLNESNILFTWSSVNGASAQVPVYAEENSSDFLLSSARLGESLMLESQFVHSSDVRSLHPNSDKAFLLCYGGRSVSLVDKSGKTERRTDFDVALIDIAMSHNGKNLWMIDTSNTIWSMAVDYSNARTRFQLSGQLFSMCATIGNKILIGLEGKVQMFTTSGKLLQCSQHGDAKKNLLKYPVRLTECPLSRNIGVINKDRDTAVIVMDGILKVKYQYTGTGNGTDLFCPEDICFDLQGNLIIANNAADNKSIIAVDYKTHQPCPLYSVSNEKGPVAIGVDRMSLWVVFKKKRIKVFRYGQ